MINFQYTRANDVADALRQIAGDPNAKFVAGGTNLIDLMKMDVEQPTKVIDITRLYASLPRAAGSHYVRSVLNAVRTSCEKSCGCSHAA
jgi:CO/xanthine dehydrogenase FAD-binding subunit